MEELTLPQIRGPLFEDTYFFLILFFNFLVSSHPRDLPSCCLKASQQQDVSWVFVGGSWKPGRKQSEKVLPWHRRFPVFKVIFQSRSKFWFTSVSKKMFPHWMSFENHEHVTDSVPINQSSTSAVQEVCMILKWCVSTLEMRSKCPSHPWTSVFTATQDSATPWSLCRGFQGNKNKNQDKTNKQTNNQTASKVERDSLLSNLMPGQRRRLSPYH